MYDNHIVNDDMNIDDKWLRDFKEQENEYNAFYKEKPTSIKLYFLYVNKYNVVEFFKNDTYLLNQEQASAVQQASASVFRQEMSAVLRKDVLLSIIKNNMCFNSCNYTLVSLLKFNLDVEPEDIINMTLDKQDGSEYLSSEKEIKDIVFYDTISILQDINSLFFVYQDRLTTKINNDTRSNHAKQQHNKTHKNIKKIYINDTKASHKKYTLKNNHESSISIIKI